MHIIHYSFARLVLLSGKRPHVYQQLHQHPH